VGLATPHRKKKTNKNSLVLNVAQVFGLAGIIWHDQSK
jgi:hypothetical protein